MLGVAADAQSSSRELAVAAPVSGSVTALSVAPGNMINDPTQPLMTIADLSTVWVTALVAEKDMPSPQSLKNAKMREVMLAGRLSRIRRCCVARCCSSAAMPIVAGPSRPERARFEIAFAERH